MVEAMKLHAIELPKPCGLDKKCLRWIDSTTQVQVKLDGHRRFMYKDYGGKLHVYGRNYSTVTYRRENIIDRVGKTIRDMLDGLQWGVCLDGEITAAGGTSMDVPTLMKVDSPDLVFTCFGILAIDNHYSAMSLWKDEQTCRDLGVPWVDSWKLKDLFATYPTPFDGKDRLAPLISVLEDHRGDREGFVLKNSAWGPMAKYKPAETYDVVVTDVTMGMGKYAACIGALCCSMYDAAGRLVEVAKVSGMTDEERNQFTASPPLGQVIEIAAQAWTGRGRLRHPRFKRMRPDKPAAECRLPKGD